MSQKDYGELFCQAVDEIVKQRLDAIKYDETILATIVDISKSDDGVYQVSDGSTRFEAHSSNTTYKVNDQVYVQIPMGDWNEQKLILSKKTGKNIAPVAYRRPFDSYVDVTNNVITKNLEVHGLVANDPTEEQSVVLWSYNTSLDKNIPYFEEGPELVSYTRLGIQASFQSWLYDFNTVSGKYGIKLRVKAIKEDADDETEEILYYDYVLSTSDMIGNPYNFESYFTQQKVFDISEIHKITEMELLFYEEPGTFFDKNGSQIPYLKEWSNDGDTEIYRVDDNIFVKDIFISFGYDVNEFEDNTIRIYTFDSSQYDRYLDPPENNHKELWLRWIKKDEDGNLRVVSADDNLDYTILWYRKKLGVKSDTAYSGVDWKLLSTQEYKNGEYVCTINDESWLIYNQSAGIGYNRQPAYNSTWLIPNIDEATEQIKAIIMFEGSPYYSQNILEFTNKNSPISTPTLEAKNSLIINCEDGTFGNYCIYGTNGSLLDAAKGSETRVLKAYFKDPYLPESTPTQLTEAEWIEWTIPSQNTMFVVDESYLGTDYRIDLDGNYVITRYGVPSEKYNIVNQNSQNYRIKNHYSQTYNNNTIICRIKKGDIIYSISKVFTFGPSGTAGTDYTFLLDFNEGKNALTIGEDAPVIVRARLYDYEGKEILGMESRNIVWSWINGDSQMMFELPYKENNVIQNNKIELQLGSNFDGELTESELAALLQTNYCILQATLKKDNGAGNGGWGDYDLKAYLPIPIRTSSEYVAMSGPTEIMYNSRGELEGYFQNPYCLYVETEEKLERTSIYDKWEVFSKNQGANEVYLPKIQASTSTENPTLIAYRLRPLNVYVEGAVSALCVVGYINDTPVWSNPLYIYQNKYGSSIINDWNGELTIDKENNIILAASMAAGKKEQDNTFSGVMMGDWSDDLDSETYTGLYGFHHGAQSFGFRQDGTGFIGKSGKGRILLKGDTGDIESQNWAAKQLGMHLSIDTGAIKMAYNDSYTRIGKISHDEWKTMEYLAYKPYFLDWSTTSSEGRIYYTPETYVAATNLTEKDYVANRYYLLQAEVKDDQGNITSPKKYTLLTGDWKNAQELLTAEKAKDSSATILKVLSYSKVNFLQYEASKYYYIDEGEEIVKYKVDKGAIQTEGRQYYSVVTYLRDNTVSEATYIPNTHYLYNENKEQYTLLTGSWEDVELLLENANENNQSVYFVYPDEFEPVSFATYKAGQFYYQDQVNTYINTATYDYSETYYKPSASQRKYITLSAAEGKWPLAIGKEASEGSRPFRVSWDGTVYINDGNFSGHIEAESGTLGDLSVIGTLEVYDGSIVGASVSYNKTELYDYRHSGYWLDEQGIHIGSSKNYALMTNDSTFFYNEDSGTKGVLKITGLGIDLYNAAGIDIANGVAPKFETDKGPLHIGWDALRYNMPYIRFGWGTENHAPAGQSKTWDAGILKKGTHGLWLGTYGEGKTFESIPEAGANAVGIFVDFWNGNVYRYDWTKKEGGGYEFNKTDIRYAVFA